MYKKRDQNFDTFHLLNISSILKYAMFFSSSQNRVFEAASRAEDRGFLQAQGIRNRSKPSEDYFFI